MSHVAACPLISVCMPAYNVESYIGYAIESVLAQKGNFRIRLLIGEDCSTDKTAEIIRSYAAKHPDVIIPVLHTHNLGLGLNTLALIKMSKESDYIAFIDSDDCWTDSGKLQRQLDYLASHPELAACYHNCDQTDENGHILTARFYNAPKNVFTQDELFKMEGYFSVSTLFARKVALEGIPETWFCRFHQDWILDLWVSNTGPVGFIDECMAIYRFRSTSLHTSIGLVKQRINKLQVCLNLLKNNIFNGRFDRRLKGRIGGLAFQVCIESKSIDKNVFHEHLNIYLRFGFFAHRYRFFHNLAAHLLFPEIWVQIKKVYSRVMKR